MAKIPLHFKDDEFFNDFGTTCYINYEKMVDNFPLYRHNFIEISLILEGSGIEIINGKKYPIHTGCVSVTMPWHFHTIITSYNAPIKRFICEFSLEDYLNYAEIWPRAKQAIFDNNYDFVLELDDTEFNRCTDILNTMYGCFTSDYIDKQSLLYVKLVEFMMLFRHIQESKKNRGTKSHEKEETINKALRYIHQYYKDDISLASVAKAVGISTGSLSEQLETYTGQDFHKLLNDIRIRNACILLGLRTPTIKYIAENVGFQSIQTFYRVFKEIKGVSPEQFRKKHYMESEGKAGYLMYNNQIWELLYYIHLHFDEDITPDSVARELNISTSYLHKIIKYNLMQSFSELLNEIRISYACGLLQKQDITIGQVAVECGYNNTRTFNRAFQTLKGCSPAEYKEKLAESEEVF